MNNNSEGSAMSKISTFIVDHRKLISIIVIALIVFSVFSKDWVHLEDTVIEFLPSDAESKVCLDVMADEFVSYGYGQIIVEDVSVDEALKLCDDLRTIDHMDDVRFNAETEYVDNSALLTVYFDTEESDELSYETMDNVREMLKDYEIYVHTSIGTGISQIVAEQTKVVVAIFSVVVLIVLLLTTESFGEVLVLICVFLVAVIISYGTHFILGTISLISNSVFLVLQLTLSMDYAIILCNRYKEERKLLDRREALIKALTASIPAILASSLTTIAGLYAMTLMQFKLGADLGFVLIKGIVINLLTVFLVMPTLLMIFDKLISRTKHKRFIPKVSFIGKFGYATRFIMPFIFLIAVIGGFVISRETKFAYDLMYVPAFNETENDYALRTIETRFNQNMMAMVIPSGDFEAEKELVDELSACDEVTYIISLANTEAVDGYMLADSVNYEEFGEIADTDSTTSQALFAYYAAENGDHREVENSLADYKVPLIDLLVFLHDDCLNADIGVELEQAQIDLIEDAYSNITFARNQLQSDKFSRMLIYTNLPMQDQRTYDFIDHIHMLAGKYYPEDVYVSGDSMLDYDISLFFDRDNLTVTALSILFVLIILFFTYKSIAMPLLLILVIQGSIWINFAIPAMNGTYVYFVSYLIVTAVQMGSNIDYAIVVSSRYRELRNTNDRREAIIEAVNLSFPTIITSGLMMVIAGFLIGFKVSEASTSGIGYYIGIGTLITLCLVLFALPQILVLGDGIVQKTTLAFGSKLKFKNPRRALRKAVSLILTVAAVATLVLVPVSGISLNNDSQKIINHCDEQLDGIADLEKLCSEFDVSKQEYDEAKLAFAEGYVTEKVGRDELEAGKDEYNKGKAELDSGEAEYEKAAKEYEEAAKQYEAGKAKLESGQAEYDAGLREYNEALKKYNEGKAQYEASLQQYNEGCQKFNEGKKRYDEGLAAYNAGLAEYNSAKAELDSVESLYETVSSAYQSYQSTQAQYDAAVASGDVMSAALLLPYVTAGRAAFETSLGSYGSIASLISEVESGRVQLAEAEKELEAAKAELDAGKAELEAGEAELFAAEDALNAGEEELARAEKELAAAKAKLDAGKAELESGKAELAAGEKELSDGKKALDDARKELDDGHSELESAGEELDEGRKRLEDNDEKLKGSISDLDEYINDEDKIINGTSQLMTVPGIKSLAGEHPTYAGILSAARNYYTNLSDETSTNIRYSRWAGILLIASAILSLVSALFLLIQKHFGIAAVTGILATAAGIIGLVLWSVFGSGNAPLIIAAVILCIAAAICAEVLSKQKREQKLEALAE